MEDRRALRGKKTDRVVSRLIKDATRSFSLGL